MPDRDPSSSPVPPSGPYDDPRIGQSIVREWARQGQSGAVQAMAEAERHRAPPPGAVLGIPGIAGPVAGSPASDFDILIGRNQSSTPGWTDILTERERRLLREAPSELDRLLANGPEDDFLRGQEKKAARAARADIRRGGLTIPGIRGTVTRGGAAADIFAQQAQDWAFWLGREFALARERLGRDFPNDPGRRGRPTSTTGRKSRTNRRGAAATRLPKPAPTVASGAPPGQPPAGTSTKPGSTRQLPPGRPPVAAPRTARTPERGRTPGRAPGRAGGGFGIPGRPGMPSTWPGLPTVLPRARVGAPGRARAPSPPRFVSTPAASFPAVGLSPLLPSPSSLSGGGSGVSTSQPDLTPSRSALLGFTPQTQTQTQCDCGEKPKRTRTRKRFDCSNPLISRSVTKDGIITIKRKLLCPSSKPK